MSDKLPMKITLTKLSRKCRVNLKRLRCVAHWLARAAGLENFSSLDILLTDDDGIVAANRAVFGRDYITDVISLSYPPMPGELGSAGELIINVDLAKREGAHRAGGPDRELALYLAHGCDHLAGNDDTMPTQRASMRRRELRWLRAAKTKGLLTG